MTVCNQRLILCNRKMQIPAKLKIGGHIYKVETRLGDDNLDVANCGRTNRDKGIIAINKSLMQSEREVTLFHEIFHCINNQLNEITSESLAQQIYAVLKNNNMLK